MMPKIKVQPHFICRVITIYVLCQRVSFLTEKGEKRLVEESRLNSANVTGLVLCSEVNASDLGGLNVTAELGGGLGLTVLSLAEAETGLHAGADRVGVAVVDAAGHKTADAVLRVAVQLEASSEGGCHGSIAHLGGDAQLGDNLTVGVD